MASSIVATVVIAWVFNGTGGQRAADHVAARGEQHRLRGLLLADVLRADSVRQSWLLAAAWSAMAIGVVAIFGPQHLSRHHRKVQVDDRGSPAAHASTSLRTAQI